MTKITNSRLYRTFEEPGEHDFGLERRKSRIAPLSLGQKPCRACGRPMLVAPGQIANLHKECRLMRSSKGRRKMAKMRDYKSIISR